MKPASMMEETVVVFVSIKITAQTVYVLEMVLNTSAVLIHYLGMDIAMTKPTMLSATLMEVTVVCHAKSQLSVQNVFAMKEGNQHGQMRNVSDLLIQ